jgi:ribosomal protein S18 acetylase RimI-like enzyme
MAMSDPSIQPAHDLGPLDIEALEDRLYEHNVAATGHRDGQGLGFVVRAEDGRQIGAIAGHTWGGVAEIKQLWVNPADRGRGLGMSLLDAAVAEAERRGCHQAMVMSYDFQAPGLYERRGFERIVELEDWPRGHTHVLLRKRLGSTAPPGTPAPPR